MCTRKRLTGTDSLIRDRPARWIHISYTSGHGISTYTESLADDPENELWQPCQSFNYNLSCFEASGWSVSQESWRDRTSSGNNAGSCARHEPVLAQRASSHRKQPLIVGLFILGFNYSCRHMNDIVYNVHEQNKGKLNCKAYAIRHFMSYT